MGTKYDFEWVKNLDFARRLGQEQHKYTICYGTIVCHALFYFYKSCQDDGKATQEVFEKFFNCYVNKQSFVQADFLELYIFDKENKGKGYLLVDLSKGCFPLVIYPDSNSSFYGEPNPSRLSGFKKIISIIKENIIPIIEEFSKHTEWNRTLEETLKKRYFDPSIAENKEP